MAVYDPDAPPFYETERGGGPVTEWMKARNRALDKAQDKKLVLLDPRSLNESVTPHANRKPSYSPGMTYQERRRLGLCTSCGHPANGYARCEACRTRYNARPSRAPEYCAAWRRRKRDLSN